MNKHEIVRRDFLKTVMAGLPALALDWTAMPQAGPATSPKGPWDAVIIGAGLGGLSCAAAFARQGFRPLVLEQHTVAGGYATSFTRPGGFVFDTSLHSTVVGERKGVHNLIVGWPEIADIAFVPHKPLYRAIFPDHDIRVPAGNPGAYRNNLAALFPHEADNLSRLFTAMSGLSTDIRRYREAGNQVNMATFPQEFPWLYQAYTRTWEEFQNLYLKDAKLKAIVSSLWGYYGLPPTRLASLYYAMPTWGYLSEGGWYPIGRSQAIANALVAFIETHGGKVILHCPVDRILVRDGAAYGVKTPDGREFRSRAIVANACAPDVFTQLLDPAVVPADYRARLEGLQVSLSAFQVFLGLKNNLVRKLGISEAEIFCNPGYDPEADYKAAQVADVETCGFGVTLYNNLYRDYSPAGKNTLNILALQGWDHWQPFEKEYRENRKEAYRAEKERLADILIERLEKKLMPGLRAAIEVKEIGTPLTHMRYTRNRRGAIYGFDQTLNNSGSQRLSQRTPIRNLWLTGAWTQPGHGYGAVIPSGLMCFAGIAREWQTTK